MTTNRDTIKRALRKLGALASGAEPKAQAADDAMGVLASMFLEWVDTGLFGSLVNVTVTADATALPGQRVYAATGVTITLPTPFTPPYSDQGSEAGFIWDYGWPRYLPYNPLQDGSIIIVCHEGGAQDINVFKSASSSWIKISPEGLNDDFPFSEGWVNGVAAMLALRLAPEYGEEPSSLVVREAQNAQVAMTHRYANQRRPVGPAFGGNPLDPTGVFG